MARTTEHRFAPLWRSNVGTAWAWLIRSLWRATARAESILIDLPPLATVMFEWAP